MSMLLRGAEAVDSGDDLSVFVAVAHACRVSGLASHSQCVRASSHVACILFRRHALRSSLMPVRAASEACSVLAIVPCSCRDSSVQCAFFSYALFTQRALLLADLGSKGSRYLWIAIRFAPSAVL